MFTVSGYSTTQSPHFPYDDASVWVTNFNILYFLPFSIPHLCKSTSISSETFKFTVKIEYVSTLIWCMYVCALASAVTWTNFLSVATFYFSMKHFRCQWEPFPLLLPSLTIEGINAKIDCTHDLKSELELKGEKAEKKTWTHSSKGSLYKIFGLFQWNYFRTKCIQVQITERMKKFYLFSYLPPSLSLSILQAIVIYSMKNKYSKTSI